MLRTRVIKSRIDQNQLIQKCLKIVWGFASFFPLFHQLILLNQGKSLINHVELLEIIKIFFYELWSELSVLFEIQLDLLQMTELLLGYLFFHLMLLDNLRIFYFVYCGWDILLDFFDWQWVFLSKLRSRTWDLKLFLRNHRQNCIANGVIRGK